MPFESIPLAERKEKLPKTEKFIHDNKTVSESEFEYDEDGRLSGIYREFYGDGTARSEEVTFEYDSAGNVLKETAHVSARELNHVQVRAIERALDRIGIEFNGDMESLSPEIIAKFDGAIGMGPKMIRRYSEHDLVTENMYEDGLKTLSEERREYPDGVEEIVRSTEYAYDDKGRLIRESTVSGESMRESEFTYDAQGRLDRQTVVDGRGHTISDTVRQYDKKGNVKRLDQYSGGKQFGHFDYTHDEEGRVVSSTRTYHGAEIEWYTFAYDKQGKLIDKGWRFDNYPDTLREIHSKYEYTY